MTADREQTQRDAELDELLQLARQCNDAEFIYEALEQAERERDEALDRLSKVPALVEKARRAKSQAAAPDYDEEAIRDALWDLVEATLAAFEEPGVPS